ncbi:MAG: hypothetical protein WAV47_02535 [Blastocatellia bacterium]
MREFRIQVSRLLGLLIVAGAFEPALAETKVSLDEASGGRETTGYPRPVPRAVTPFTSFSFGDVYTGEVISQIFVIRNEGDGELQIKDFKAG